MNPFHTTRFPVNVLTREVHERPSELVAMILVPDPTHDVPLYATCVKLKVSVPFVQVEPSGDV
jgi:hypothetical protein